MAVSKKKGKSKTPNSYGELHKSLDQMTEMELIDALQQEVDREHPRHNMIDRLVGRFNRLRGSRVRTEVMGLLSKKKGSRSVVAVLDSNR